ncbi:MAG: hypothetical protein C4532_07315 [Candidatus Abyssobacteria bacterium SURF_17]|uniref:PilZ domain-containing protein n=1 Tax=Candidatus Abyssobacteria bacterium SURF_17 TaxID=2093361 RepID=A0A419F0S4_9BACT|nr:MAG: hypothetical protein C4532_07315 [Candidatus Abyssubacteria bacterium SURF_17]
MTMEEPEVVSPSRIERLLDLASVYNVPLSITAESRDKLYRYKSRMLDFRKAPGSNTLIIDHPVTDGPAIALVPDTRITVYFALDRKRFLFESTVVRKVSFTLASRRKISALEIAYPNALASGQRRSYYRVSVPSGKLVSVECGVVSGRTDWFVQEPGTWNFPSRVQFEGRIVNVSVGGILLAVKDAARGVATVGTKLGLWFSLAPNETPVVLKGIVRRVDRASSGEEDTVAIEFIDTAEKFEYKLAINRLFRYVAERQREIIKTGAI